MQHMKKETKGMWLGLLGVAIFALPLPPAYQVGLT